MDGRTHRKGGTLSVLIGFNILHSKGILFPDASPYLQLLVMYPYGIWGGVASDLDHNPDSIPARDVLSLVINKALHPMFGSYMALQSKLNDDSVDSRVKRRIRMSGRYKFLRFINARHRSWQTHSDLTLALLVMFLLFADRLLVLTRLDLALLLLMGYGAVLGLVSHLILDILTTEGIHLLLFKCINYFLLSKIGLRLPEKISVPNWKCFHSGGKFEKFICKFLDLSSVFVLCYTLVRIEYPELPSIVFSYLIELVSKINI